MDVATLNRIAELATQSITATSKAHTPALILNNQVHSIEHLQAHRSRFRGVMSTSSLADFVSYVEDHPGGEGFIDPKDVRCTVYHNLGSAQEPGHADWRSELRLEPTAAYAALLSIEGKPLPQRELVEWIEDWSAQLTAERAGTSEHINTAVTAIRELTVEAKKSTTSTDRDFGASRSAFEEIEAKAKGGIPNYLIMTAQPYQGLQAREFKLRLSVITGERPQLTLRIVGKEALQEEIVREFKTALIEEIGDKATLTIGTFKP